jgi:SAM-dependent methyltransferase
MNMELPEYTVLENGYIHGTWFCGRPTEKYYGSHPKGFWRRAQEIIGSDNMLHWFCGLAEGGHRVDGNPDVNPDTVCVGTALPFPDNHFDSAYADPPYSPRDAKRYGLKYPPARTVLREMARVTKPGRLVGLLHEFLPVVKGSGCKLVGVIGIINGPQKRIRGFYLFRKLENTP